MKKHSVLLAPLLAFYSKSFYRDVAQQWRGSGVLYPLLLLAVCCAPLTVAAQFRSFNPRAAMLSPLAQLPDGLPPITLQHGSALVEAEQPCFITDPATGKLVMIIDTTGGTASLEGTGATFLLTKTQVVIRRAPREVTAHELSALPFNRLSRDVVRAWLWWLKGPLALLFYSVAFLLSCMYVLAQNIVCSGFGLFVVRDRRWQFNYRTMMRLAGVAATPAVALATVGILAGVRAPLYAWLIASFTVSMGYLYYAIRAATELRGSDLGASPDMPSFSVR
ncbi:MAG: DUF1189 domain-containing protein [Planctomycetes bacterium]|nr:DUF1189 domain-containing protein [Planctomycetota bacterium]